MKPRYVIRADGSVELRSQLAGDGVAGEAAAFLRGGLHARSSQDLAAASQGVAAPFELGDLPAFLDRRAEAADWLAGVLALPSAHPLGPPAA